jgi:branched-chain amino acid transport system substrate-binding protein
MTHRSKILISIVSFVILAGAYPGPKYGQCSETVIVGILHSEAYPYATMMKNSFSMALDKINKDGGIKGRPLQLVYADDQGKPKEGEQAVRQLVNDKGAVMLVGAYQSSNTIQMANIANKLDRPLLVSTAADDRVTQRKWRNVYRLNVPASEYASGLEDFLLKKIKPKSMAIIYENSPFGTGSALRMMWFCRENNIDIRAITPYHKERLKIDYFNRIIAPLVESPPDVIYMVSYLNDGTLLVKQLRELKINALLCGGAGGFTHHKFIDKTGPLAEKLLTATLWTPQLRYDGTAEFYNQYADRYGTPPDYHGAEAFSALLVAANVLESAESFQPKNIRAALDAIDMMTPFGPVQFTSYGKYERQNSLPTQVLQIIDGKFECIWPQKHVTSTFVEPLGWRNSIVEQ